MRPGAAMRSLAIAADARQEPAGRAKRRPARAARVGHGVPRRRRWPRRRRCSRRAGRSRRRSRGRPADSGARRSRDRRRITRALTIARASGLARGRIGSGSEPIAELRAAAARPCARRISRVERRRRRSDGRGSVRALGPGQGLGPERRRAVRPRGEVGDRLGEAGRIACGNGQSEPVGRHGRAELADVGRDHRPAEGGGEIQHAALRRLDVGQRHRVGVEEQLRDLVVLDEGVAHLVARRVAHQVAMRPGVVAAPGDDDPKVRDPVAEQRFGPDQLGQALVGEHPTEHQQREAAAVRAAGQALAPGELGVADDRGMRHDVDAVERLAEPRCRAGRAGARRAR